MDLQTRLLKLVQQVMKILLDCLEELVVPKAGKVIEACPGSDKPVLFISVFVNLFCHKVTCSTVRSMANQSSAISRKAAGLAVV